MKTWTPKAEVSARPDTDDPSKTEIVVDVTWTGPEKLDRPCTEGWVFSKSQRNLAERLAAAINAGAAFKSPSLRRDIYGKTYVEAETTQFFHKRHMNSSLKAVGF